ncbi:MAG: AmpG family muropeptide MFS transporter [Alphaproteobacteria bacterium]|nr:AmpG family muropeptide MFS transporter [Alphaproteobacteria bacterium]
MRDWSHSLSIYLERRVAVITVFGFASGLPLALVYATLSAWLSDTGVSKTAIGLFVWASAAYSIKFLWAPLVDRMPLPLLTSWLGQRRGWLLASQILAAGCMVGLGSSDPATALWWTAAWAMALAFASATQDIVADAYRVESLEEDQLGAGAATFVFGYRIAMMVSGGGALLIAHWAGWFWAYAVMAVLMLIGMAATLISPEPDRDGIDGVAAEEAKNIVAWLRGAVVAPFSDFVHRPDWLIILLFVGFYKYGDALLGVMANPFYLETGFSMAEIGVISKSYGMLMTILGGIAGGVLVARMGILKALMICGILQAASNPVFALQAWVGYSVPMLTATISIENFTGGMATTAFVAYLSSLCNVAYTATQYALLSSFMGFARTIFASGGGWLADNVDWISYFLLTTVAAVPGLVLLAVLIRRYPPEPYSGRLTEQV